MKLRRLSIYLVEAQEPARLLDRALEAVERAVEAAMRESLTPG